MTRRESLFALTTHKAAGLVDVPLTRSRILNVVKVGGHPDDPETGCGATPALYASGDHNVTVNYLTRGEAGIAGKTHDEAARTRIDEPVKAFRLDRRPSCAFRSQSPSGHIRNSSRTSRPIRAKKRCPRGAGSA